MIQNQFLRRDMWKIRSHQNTIINALSKYLKPIYKYIIETHCTSILYNNPEPTAFVIWPYYNQNDQTQISTPTVCNALNFSKFKFLLILLTEYQTLKIQTQIIHTHRWTMHSTNFQMHHYQLHHFITRLLFLLAVFIGRLAGTGNIFERHTLISASLFDTFEFTLFCIFENTFPCNQLLSTMY